MKLIRQTGWAVLVPTGEGEYGVSCTGPHSLALLWPEANRHAAEAKCDEMNTGGANVYRVGKVRIELEAE